MKHTLFIIFIAFSSSVLSDSYGGAKGTNRLGHIIRFSPEDLHEIYYDGQIYEMSVECPGLIEWLDYSPNPTISCPKEGKSPLAGATYKKVERKDIKDNCGQDAFGYQCISGCEKMHVPLFIMAEPWECANDESEP